MSQATHTVGAADRQRAAALCSRQTFFFFFAHMGVCGGGTGGHLCKSVYAPTPCNTGNTDYRPIPSQYCSHLSLYFAKTIEAEAPKSHEPPGTRR